MYSIVEFKDKDCLAISMLIFAWKRTYKHLLKYNVFPLAILFTEIWRKSSANRAFNYSTIETCTYP